MKSLKFIKLGSIIIFTYFLAQPISLTAQKQTEETRFEPSLIQGTVPKASSRTVLPREVMLKSNSLGDVLEIFSQALRKAGYEQQGWYATNHNEVIAITELEQIRENGSSRIDDKRWSLKFSSPEISSIADFIRTLLQGATPGRYRSFIFFFGDDNRFGHSRNRGMQSSGIPEISFFKDFLRMGTRVPVFSFLRTAKTANLRCYVFIYEYEHSPVDGSVTFIEDSNISARQHLKGAGIWEKLEISE